MIYVLAAFLQHSTIMLCLSVISKGRCQSYCGEQTSRCIFRRSGTAAFLFTRAAQRLILKLDMKMLTHTCKAELHSGKSTESCSSSLQGPIVLLLLQPARRHLLRAL